jgi:hypothetical protein
MDKNQMVVIILLALCPAVHICAQLPLIPTEGKAVYFDVSQPLRTFITKAPVATDQSWKDGIVPNGLENHCPGNNALALANDSVIQPQNGQILPDTTIRNFDGLGNVNNVVPPDTHGDVGPSHYFQLVNLSFAIYDKTGVKLLGPFNTSRIWEGLPHNSNNGDGIVLYDEQADRWLISQFSFPSYPQGPFYQMVAVSQTPDPTGSWYRWEFSFSDLPDYPKFGIWPDGYYMSYTRLKAQTLQRDGVGAVVFDRSAMISGNPAPVSIQFLVPASEVSISFLPSDCDGSFPPAGTPNYYGSVRNGFLTVMEFHADWTNPSASTFGNTLLVPVSPFSFCTREIPQKESDKQLTPLDDRLMYRLQYRKFTDYEAMVVNHTVGVGSHAGIRWYELRKTNANWFVNQQSTYAPDTLNRWMGSIAMDAVGNMALGYSISGYSMYPSIRFTGRMKHDPPGLMTIRETTIIDGTGSQTGIWSQQSRWGDYSTMTVDPAAPSTFWYGQEYYATTSFNEWRTRVASFSFANVLDIQASASPPEVCAGGSTMLDVEVYGGSGNPTYAWTSYPAGFTSDLKNPWISPENQTIYIVRVVSGSQEKTDSVMVQVIPMPSVFAGNDTMICRYLSDISLSGIASNCNSVRWFTSGDGYFDKPEALNTMYHFGANDKFSDSLFLKLTAYPAIPCLPVTSTRTVVTDTCAGLNDLSGDSFQVCLHPNPVGDKLTVELSYVKENTITIAISNPLDKILMTEKIELPNHEITRQIDVSGFASGVYYLRVQTKSGIVVRPFIVK